MTGWFPTSPYNTPEPRRMNRAERRHVRRIVGRRDRARAAVVTALIDNVDRTLRLARDAEPAKARDLLYRDARRIRAEAQAALNRGDRDTADQLVAQAQRLEDAGTVLR